MKLQDLLNKYYKGETSLEEEKQLKQILSENDNYLAEQDLFSFYENDVKIPENLEEMVFDNIDFRQNRGKMIRLRLLQSISVAAVILVILSVYINLRNSRNERLEKEFITMESALYQVAETLQPEEQEEMMVLWVDDNVEIIIH